MRERFVIWGLAAALAGCAPQLTVKQAFAQCRAEDQRAKAAAGDEADVLTTCMEAHGFEVKAGYCSLAAAPDRVEACYRRAVK